MEHPLPAASIDAATHPKPKRRWVRVVQRIGLGVLALVLIAHAWTFAVAFGLPEAFSACDGGTDQAPLDLQLPASLEHRGQRVAEGTVQELVDAYGMKCWTGVRTTSPTRLRTRFLHPVRIGYDGGCPISYGQKRATPPLIDLAFASIALPLMKTQATSYTLLIHAPDPMLAGHIAGQIATPEEIRAYCPVS